MRIGQSCKKDLGLVEDPTPNCRELSNGLAALNNLSFVKALSTSYILYSFQIYDTFSIKV